MYVGQFLPFVLCTSYAISGARDNGIIMDHMEHHGSYGARDADSGTEDFITTKERESLIEGGGALVTAQGVRGPFYPDSNPCGVCTTWRGDGHPHDEGNVHVCKGNPVVHADGSKGFACYETNAVDLCEWDWVLLHCGDPPGRPPPPPPTTPTTTPAPPTRTPTPAPTRGTPPTFPEIFNGPKGDWGTVGPGDGSFFRIHPRKLLNDAIRNGKMPQECATDALGTLVPDACCMNRLRERDPAPSAFHPIEFLDEFYPDLSYPFSSTRSFWKAQDDATNPTNFNCKNFPGFLWVDQSKSDLVGVPDGKGVGGYYGCDNGKPIFAEHCMAPTTDPNVTSQRPFRNGDTYPPPAGVRYADGAIGFNAHSVEECQCVLKLEGSGCYKKNDYSSMSADYESDDRVWFQYVAPCTSPPGDGNMQVILDTDGNIKGIDVNRDKDGNVATSGPHTEVKMPEPKHPYLGGAFNGGDNVVPGPGNVRGYLDSETLTQYPQCNTEAVGTRVPDECCSAMRDSLRLLHEGSPFEPESGTTYTCPVHSVVDNNDHTVQSYLGCEGGVVTYGESCFTQYENQGHTQYVLQTSNNDGDPDVVGEVPAGTPNYPYPPGADVHSRNAWSWETCQCWHRYEGQGCYKASDASTFLSRRPTFEDGKKWFVRLDDKCSAPTPAPQPMPTAPSKFQGRPPLPATNPVVYPLDPPTATYEVTWNLDWHIDTHGPRTPWAPRETGTWYSPPVVQSHPTEDTAMFKMGELASPGVGILAELGREHLLFAEVQAAGYKVSAGCGVFSSLGFCFNHAGGEGQFGFPPMSEWGITPTDSKITMYIEVDNTNTMVSGLTMLAPTPDFITGFSSFPLADLQTNEWVDHAELRLHPMDAGVDANLNWFGNAEEHATWGYGRDPEWPQSPIRRIEGAWFQYLFNSTDVGSVTFKRVQNVGAATGGDSAFKGFPIPTLSPAVAPPSYLSSALVEQSAPPSDVDPVGSSANYKVTWHFDWDRTTHDYFQSGLHGPRTPLSTWFSPPVLQTHATEDTAMFKNGELASPGMKLLSEQGTEKLLTAEMEVAGHKVKVGCGDFKDAQGHCFTKGNSTLTMTIEVDRANPLMSGATMIAPSPDFFTGFTAFSLVNVQTGGWLTEGTVRLNPMDAGVDGNVIWGGTAILPGSSNRQDDGTFEPCGTETVCKEGSEGLWDALPTKGYDRKPLRPQLPIREIKGGDFQYLFSGKDLGWVKFKLIG